MAAKKTGKKNKTEKRKKDTIRNQVKAIVFIAAAVFLFVCIQFTDQTGLLGTVMNLIFKTVLGEAALALPFFFLVVSLGYFWPYRIENLKYRLLGLIIVFGILTISLHLRIFLQEPVVDGKSMFSCMMELGLLGRGGGLLGALLTAFLFFLFRDLGSYIVIISLGLIALLLMTNSSLLELFHGLRGIFTFFLNHFKNFSRVLSYGEGKEETKKGNSYKIRDYKSFNAKKEGKEKREENGIRKEGKNDLIVFPEGAEVIQEKKLPEGAEKGEIVGEGRVNNGLPQGLPLGEVPVTTLVPIPGANESYGDYTVPSLALLTRVNKLKDYQQQKLIHERARTLENAFGSIKKSSVSCKNGLPKRNTPKYQRVKFATQRDIEQLHLNMAFEIPSFVDKLRYEFTIINAILGGDVNSRLFQEIREQRGLTYNICTYGSAFFDTGLFHIYAALNASQKDEVISLIRGIITDLCENGVTSEEVANAKKQVIVEMTLNRDNTVSLMNSNAKAVMFYNEIISFKDTIKAIDRVSVESINECIRKYFDLDKMSVALAGKISE